MPSCIEISGIIPINSGSKRNIIFRKQVRDENGQPRDKLMTENQISALYEPLHYVLLFHHGEPGWQIDVDHGGDRPTRSSCLSDRENTAYRIQVRENDFKHLHYFGRLFTNIWWTCLFAWKRGDHCGLKDIRKRFEQLNTKVF